MFKPFLFVSAASAALSALCPAQECIWEPGHAMVADKRLFDTFNPFVGRAIATWGESIAVTAYHEDSSYRGHGIVYIYEANEDGSYGMTAQLTVPDVFASFGASVAIDGSSVLVGAPDDGVAFLFEDIYDYPESYKLLVSGSMTSVSSQFGRSVLLHDGTAYVGAPGDGCVYYYSVDTPSISPKRLKPDAFTPGYGYSLTASVSVLAVGAPDSASAFVYELQSSPIDPEPVWELDAVLRPEFHDPADLAISRFGHALSINKDYSILIGDPGVEAVFPYRHETFYVGHGQPPSDAWVAKSAILPYFVKTGSEFGAKVAHSGSRAIVAAPGYGPPIYGGGYETIGAVFCCELDDDYGWGLVCELHPDVPKGSVLTSVGDAVAIMGDTLLAHVGVDEDPQVGPPLTSYQGQVQSWIEVPVTEPWLQVSHSVFTVAEGVGPFSLELRVPPADAHRSFLISGAFDLAGDMPLPLGPEVTWPLATDGYTEVLLAEALVEGGTSMIQGDPLVGQFDADGRAEVFMSIPSGTSILTGKYLRHAFLLFDSGLGSPVIDVSNPVYSYVYP